MRTAILLPVLGGCSFTVHDDGTPDVDVDGDGDIDGDDRITGYLAVDNETDAKLVFSADEDSVAVSCDDIDVTEVSLSLDGDKLMISAEADTSSCVVTVSSDVDTVESGGDGDVACDDELDVRTIDVRGNGNVDLAELHTDEVTVTVRGNGEVHIGDLQADKATFDLSGNGDTTVAGAVGTGALHLSGNGDFYGKDLVFDTLDADVSGSGSAEVNVGGTGTITVSGNGHVTVYGDGEIDGDGDIDEG
jgi:hypothetical protein